MKIGSSRAMGALVVGSLCLAACSEAPRKPSIATPTPAAQATSTTMPSGRPDDIVVVDARPARDKSYSIHSLWVTNCNYGVYTIGDATPMSPIDTLHADLRDFEGASSTHRVRVDHYSVYLNSSRQLKRGAVGAAFGGLIGAAIANAVSDDKKGSSCPAGKMDGGGWYGPGERTTNFPPIVVEMSGTFDEKHFVKRVVYSPHQQVNVKLKKPSDLAEYEAAVHKANQALFTSIGLSKNTAPPAPAAPAGQPDDEGWINFPSSDSK